MNAASGASSDACGVRHAALAEMLEFIRSKQHPIDSVVVMRDGEVLFDCTFRPYRAGDLHALYSCTKTIVGILIGIAVDKGYIADIRRPIADFLAPEQRGRLDEAKRALTLEHFLTMTTGLDIQDHGGNFGGYFAMTRSADLLDHVLGLALIHAPGAQFRYNNGGSHVLCCALRAATGTAPLEFAREHLFRPLGIENVSWDANLQAGNTGWAGISLAPLDLAKIGQLYLQRGRWDEKQIVSEAWVSASTHPHIPAKPHGNYGYHWWREQDQYEAVGLFGQYMFVLPQRRAVVVINSSLPASEFLLPKYLLSRFLLPAIDGAGERDLLAAARLRSLVARAAQAKDEHCFVWHSEAEGVCRDGVFERTAAPAFRFHCPPRMTMEKTTWKNQVGAMKTFEGLPFFVSVSDIPRGVGIERAGVHFAVGLKSFGTAEQFEILSNRAFALGCGNAAFRTDIRYKFKGSTLCTAVVLSAYRDGKWICLEGHTPGDSGELAAMVESLSFDMQATLPTRRDSHRAG